MDPYQFNTSSSADLFSEHQNAYTANQIGNDVMELGQYGPYYRVDSEKLVIPSIDGQIEINKDYVFYHRTQEIKNYLVEHSIQTAEIIDYLDENIEGIEMIFNFPLLDFFRPKIPNGHHEQMRELFQKTSSGRWWGEQEPLNYQHANILYNIENYRNGRKISHLYKMALNVTEQMHRLGPKNFPGSVTGGSGWQFKLNNVAMQSITQIEEIKNSNWPFTHPA